MLIETFCATFEYGHLCIFALVRIGSKSVGSPPLSSSLFLPPKRHQFHSFPPFHSNGTDITSHSYSQCIKATSLQTYINMQEKTETFLFFLSKNSVSMLLMSFEV